MMGFLQQTSYLLFVFVVLRRPSVLAFDCIQRVHGSTENGQVNASFDLCDFVISTDDGSNSGFYEIANSDASFYFNVAANIEKAVPYSECDNWNVTWRRTHGLELGYCSHIRSAGLPNATCFHDDIVPIDNRTAAYQSSPSRTAEIPSKTAAINQCWRLHDGISDPIWSFVDATNPTIGVQVTYPNGDWCSAYGKNREFQMVFLCSNESSNPSIVERVTESQCEYQIVMETSKGCPAECPVENGRICSGNGVCEYDWKREEPKCFCFHGWYGSDCGDTEASSEESYNDNTALYVALLAVIILLFVTLFVLGYLLVRCNRMKNQPLNLQFLARHKRQHARNNEEYDDGNE